MTLQGVIYYPDGSPYLGAFDLRLALAPVDGISGTTTGLPLRVLCDGVSPSGEYSTPLRAGTYDVDIPGVAAFRILAPTGSATYSLEAIRV